MTMPFQIDAVVRWAEVDMNGHTRNSAYLDLASQARISFFDQHGFSANAFFKQKIGPVVFKDELIYKNETHMGDALQVRLMLAGLSPSGFRFAFRNEIYKGDGSVAVIINSFAGWLDLERRKLINPPERLLEVINQLHRCDDFTILADRAPQKKVGS